MDAPFQVQLKIRKPAAEVCDAVVDANKITGYFLGEASGPLVAGATVMWKFPEFDFRFEVVVRAVLKDERIVFDWPAAGSDGAYNTTVTMTFVPLDAGNTMVQVSEAGWRGGEAALPFSHGNAGGWMFFISALKAYLEYGINLRAGGLR
jgi:uncharacterized protein YndB with AHSA1/START domain